MKWFHDILQNDVEQVLNSSHKAQDPNTHMKLRRSVFLSYWTFFWGGGIFLLMACMGFFPQFSGGWKVSIVMRILDIFVFWGFVGFYLFAKGSIYFLIRQQYYFFHPHEKILPCLQEISFIYKNLLRPPLIKFIIRIGIVYTIIAIVTALFQIL